jgi:hypothetical protein
MESCEGSLSVQSGISSGDARIGQKLVGSQLLPATGVRRVAGYWQVILSGLGCKGGSNCTLVETWWLGHEASTMLNFCYPVKS